MGKKCSHQPESAKGMLKDSFLYFSQVSAHLPSKILTVLCFRLSIKHGFCSKKSWFTRIPCFIPLQLIVLLRYCIFYRLKVCGNPTLSKSICIIFPTAFTHFMSLSYFGNSHNFSNFFIIIIFVIVICDQ